MTPPETPRTDQHLISAWRPPATLGFSETPRRSLVLPEATGMDGHEAERGTDSLGRVRPGLQTHGRQAVSVGISPSRTFQREWPRELGGRGWHLSFQTAGKNDTNLATAPVL